MATAICLLFLVPAAAAAAYYAILSEIGRGTRVLPIPAALPRTTVVIPAHDEADGLPRTIEAVRRDDASASILVIADNCTDDTAAVAAAAGAGVVVRTDPVNRGKGYALAAGLPAAMESGADVIVVLDADCELRPGSLAAFAAALNHADAAQAAVLSRAANDPGSAVAAVGSVFDSLTGAGKARLGFSAPLRGTGMAFRRGLLERLPWTAAGLAEDAEYGDRLKRAGVRVAFAAGAEVRCDAPPGTGGLMRQRRRWRAGLFVGPLGLAAKAVESKPLVLAQLLLTGGAVAVFGESWARAVYCAVFCATAWAYARACVTAQLRPQSVLGAPAVVVRLLGVTLAGVFAKGTSWQRAERRPSPAPAR